MIENQVNATRIELTKLKNQLVIAKRGHKLLRDKQDEMIRQFLEIVQKYKLLRIGVEVDLIKSLEAYGLAQETHSEIELYEKMLVSSNQVVANYGKVNIMGIMVPKISAITQDVKLTFSLIDSDPNLDESVLLLGKTLTKILEFAQIDKTCRLLVKEIEKVKRRVNAIEYFMIPELESKIKEITTKLADADRSNTIRTMKSKEIVLKKSNKE